MKTPNVFYSIILTVCLAAAISTTADEPGPAFQSDLAIRAKTSYETAIAANNQRFTQELDLALKRALQANQLEESNVINQAKAQLAEGKEVSGPFSSPAAQAAEGRYRQGIDTAQRAYLRALEFAQQRAMAAANLEEANAIKAMHQLITENLSGTVGVEDGLRLQISGQKTEVWKNTPISLPGNPAEITFSGTLQLPAKVTVLKLRSAAQFGSDRLTFVCAGKELTLVQEPNAPRHVVYEPKLNTDRVRLEIGDSIAANSWLWGPLQWSINGGSWRDIPLRNLSPK